MDPHKIKDQHNICNAITPKWKIVFSFQLYLNTMFIKMFGGHWFKKNLFLNKGFDNSISEFPTVSLSKPVQVSKIFVMIISSNFNMNEN